MSAAEQADRKIVMERAMLAALEALVRANISRRRRPNCNYERACVETAENNARAVIAAAKAAGLQGEE